MHKLLLAVALILIFSTIYPGSAGAKDNYKLDFEKQMLPNLPYKFLAFNDGYPDARAFYRDGLGYTWYKQIHYSYKGDVEQNKYYRYDGYSFTDVFSNNPTAAKDKIEGFLKLGDYIVMRGLRSIYRWKGTKLTRFLFPKGDEILWMSVFEESLYCYGNKGYALLKGKAWTYYHYDKIIRSDKDWVSTIFSSYPMMLMYRREMPLSAKCDTIIVADHSKVKRYVIQHPQKKTELDYLQSVLDKNHFLWLNFSYSGMLVGIDLKKAELHHYKLPPAKRFKSFIRDDKGEVWALCVDEKSIDLLLLSGQNPNSVAYKSISYAIPPNITTRCLIQTGSTAVSGLIKRPGFDKSETNFSNLILTLKDNPSRLEAYPIVPKPDMIYELINEHICGYRKHEKFSDVFEFDLYSIKTGELKQFTVTHPGFVMISSPTSIRVIDNDLFIGVSDGNLIVSLEKQFTAALSYNNNEEGFLDFEYIENSSTSLLPSTMMEVSSIRSDGFRKRILSYQENKWKSLYDESQNISLLWMTVLNQNLIAYQKTTAGGKVLKLDPKTRHFQQFASTIDVAFFLQEGETPCLITPDLRYEIKNDGLVSKPIKAWKSFFAPHAEVSQEHLKYLFGWLGYEFPMALSSHQHFFRTHFVESPGSYYHYDVISEKVKITQDASMIRFEIPSFIYDTAADSIILKPNWLRCLQDRNANTFIAHLKKSDKGNYLQVSRWQDGKLLEKGDDLKLFGKDSDHPYIDDYRKISNNLLSIHSADTLYYYQENKWQKVSLIQYQKYGSFKNGILVKNKLYLCFDRIMIEHREDGKPYVYTERDGLPSRISGLWTPNDHDIFVVYEGGLLKFTPPPINMRLNIGSLHSSYDGVEKSWKNAARIPNKFKLLVCDVSLLGTLYPELCTISYRLKGQSDEWIKMSHQNVLFFGSLASGKYNLEIFATDRHGHRSATESFAFRILPPWYLSWWAYILYALLLSFALRALYRWRIYTLKARNRMLEQRVEQRTAELHEKQQRILESLEYSALIQKSILPQEEQLRNLWKDHFIHWHPRDIVGGDLYWMQELAKEGVFLFAVFDCTGHGVPGALLTMTVNSALNHLVLERKLEYPHQILEQLHLEIGITLHQGSVNTQQDGLDISLIRFDYPAKTLHFAGAKQHLVLYNPEEKQLVVHRGSKYSIGGAKYHDKLEFSSQEINFSEDSIIYLYTDGIIDQPGSGLGFPRRLGSINWQNILLELAKQTIPQQKESLAIILAKLLSAEEQRDDITVVGIRL